ncbi:hypothetical protein AB0395_44785 [Streptosporangium sp. NPDC051023]|uniref:hypothetical protein n=1 Tax=Streptosporangium sp. NPDC051023 TaxID=3155410 RepID=UPI00344C5B39
MSTSTPEVTVSEPEPERWQPVERPEPEQEPAPETRRREPAVPKAEPQLGTPAGQLAVGVASVLTLGGVGLYNTVGAAGLAAGGAVAAAGAGGYGYRRWRKAHPRRDRPGGGRTQRPGGGRGGLGLPSGRGAVGRRMTFGAGAGGAGRRSASSRMPSLGRSGGGLGRGGGGRAAGGRRHSFGDRGSGGTRARGAFRPTGADRPGGRPRSGAAGARHYAAAPVRGLRSAGRAVRALHGRAVPRLARARANGQDRDAAFADVARRTGRATARRARAVGRWSRGRVRASAGWVDRRTGHRFSGTWQRLTPRLRAFAARLRQWDADLTDGLAAKTWAWWRTRRTTGETAPGPTTEASEADSAPQTSSVLARPPHPRTTLPTRSPAPAQPGTTTQGAAVSFGLITHATELPTIAAGYSSDDMMVVKGHLEMLRELPLAAATAVRLLMERLEADYPLNPEVVEAMRHLYEALAVAANPADEVAAVFSSSHAVEIDRRLQPRTNERYWNV